MTSAVHQVIRLVSQTYLVTLIGLLIGIFSARSLSIEDRGLLSMLLLISQLCSRLGALGFEQVLHQSGRQFAPVDFYRAGFVGSLLTLPVAIVSLVITRYNLWFALPMILISGFISVLRINIALLIHYEDLRRLTILNVTQAISQLAMYALAFQTHNVMVFFLLWAGNVVLFSIISSRVLPRANQTESILERLTPFQVWKRGFGYTAVNVPEIALSFCLELPIVRAVLGAQSSGLYAISNTLTGIYYQVFTAMTSIFIRLKAVASRPLIYTIMTIMCLGIILLAPLMIELLFGSRYQGAVAFLYIMLPVTLVLGIVRIEQVLAPVQAKASIQLASSLMLITMLLASLLVAPTYLTAWIAGSYVLFAVVNLWSIKQAQRNGVGYV